MRKSGTDWEKGDLYATGSELLGGNGCCPGLLLLFKIGGNRC